MAKISGLITPEECERITSAGYHVCTFSSPYAEVSDEMFWATVWVDCNLIELLDIKEAGDEGVQILR